jgi:putative hydrolase
MLEVDLHTHSFFSACGIHTHLEILERAKSLGMTAVAITDHGPSLSPRFSDPFFDRLREPVKGIRLLKGMECNLVGENGEIDLPEKYRKYLDVVLLGIHPNTKKGQGRDRYTDMLLLAMEKNPAVDILTHLNDAAYPTNFETVIKAARDLGIAVELNNSKTLLNRIDPVVTRELVAVALETGAKMAVTSDMHAIEELGLDDSVKPYLEEVSFPMERIITSTAQRAFSFIEERRSSKTA